MIDHYHACSNADCRDEAFYHCHWCGKWFCFTDYVRHLERRKPVCQSNSEPDPRDETLEDEPAIYEDDDGSIHEKV